MNRHSFIANHTLVITFVALLAAECFAQSADWPLLPEFRAAVRRWTAGAVPVTFSTEPPADSKFAGRSTYGFDPTTGAWFFTDQSRVAGRTPDGVAYRGDTDKVTPDQDQSLRLPGPLVSQIPMTLPLTLLQTTDGLLDLSRDANENWVIEYSGFAGEGQAPPRVRTIFSPEGRPLRFEMEARPWAGREAIGYDYRFVPESKEPLLIALREPPSNPRIEPRHFIEVEYYPSSRPELFTTDAVLAIAADNRMRSQMKLNAVAARMAGSPQAGGATEPVPYVQAPLTRAGWPLIISGIIVVAIGLIALFRARMGK